MSQKRRQAEEGSDGDGGGEKRQKVPDFRGVVMEVLKMNSMQKFLSALEPLVRRVVKEEVELALTKYVPCMKSQCGNQVFPSTSRSLQLKFMNKFSLPIFTGAKIEGEDSSVITIALVDGLTGQVVMSHPESSMKVEVVVLEGDFEGDEEDNWTVEDFTNNIVKERDGRRSLLTGDVFLDLNEGIGMVGELSFTDNSSWTRSRKFKLGARIVDGFRDGLRVREAKTEAFMVKDHRGELYKKHHPPLLMDEVWRLEKIGKEGAFHKRLSCENINTVKDFLTLLCTDAPRLRNILGSGMSAKMWEVTVEHARTCILGDQIFVYYSDIQRKTGVVFNIIGTVLGALSEQHFISVNDLSDAQKEDAHALVKAAFENRDAIVQGERGGIMGSSSNAPNSSTCSESLNNLYSNFSFDDDAFGLSYPSILPETSVESMRASDAHPLKAMVSADKRYEPVSVDLLCHDNFGDSRGQEKISDLVVLDDCEGHGFFNEDSLQLFDHDLSILTQSLVADSSADLGAALSGFLPQSTAVREKAHGWKTLVAVLRWRFSIRRIVKRTRGYERGKCS